MQGKTSGEMANAASPLSSGGNAGRTSSMGDLRKLSLSIAQGKCKRRRSAKEQYHPESEAFLNK